LQSSTLRQRPEFATPLGQGGVQGMSDSKDHGAPKGESSGGRERRVRVRYPTDRESMCQPGEGRLDQAWWLARITDISTTGVALVLKQLRQKFPAGTILTVELQNWTGDIS